MKNLIFLLFFLSVNTFAQEHNFKTENGTLVWEKVYNTDKTNIVSELKKNVKLDFTDDTEGVGKQNKVSCDISNYFLKKNYFDFNFTIEQKEGKYRIRAYNLLFENDMELTIYGVTKAPKKINIEEYALNNKKEIKTSKSNTAIMKCFSDYLDGIFKPIDSKNDW